MDPGWMLLYGFLLLECAVVMLLVLPVPNNFLRGLILKLVGKLTDNQGAMVFCGLVLLLDAWYFYDSMKYLYGEKSYREGTAIVDGKVVVTNPQTEYIARLRKERGAYISGFGIFLSLVFYRLVELQKQIFEYRKVIKANKLDKTSSAKDAKENVSVAQPVKKED